MTQSTVMQTEVDTSMFEGLAHHDERGTTSVRQKEQTFKRMSNLWKEINRYLLKIITRLYICPVLLSSYKLVHRDGKNWMVLKQSL